MNTNAVTDTEAFRLGMFPERNTEALRCFPVEVVKSWRFCPVCGRPASKEVSLEVGREMCLPRNCDAWKAIAHFNHETRQWAVVEEEK